MFTDQFFPQLVFFLLTQVAAFGLLRTGMLVWGFLVLILGWVLGDLALVLHFVFPGEVVAYHLSLWGLQVVACVSTGLFFGWRWQRKRPAFRWEQEQLFGQAMDAFMAGSDDKARALYQRLRKRDPWDIDARVFLGRLAEGRKAMSRLNCALRLSGESPIATEIQEELRCLMRKAKQEIQVTASHPARSKPNQNRRTRKAAG